MTQNKEAWGSRIGLEAAGGGGVGGLDDVGLELGVAGGEGGVHDRGAGDQAGDQFA